MRRHAFETPDGTPVTAVTAEEMREVDRIAIEDLGLDLLQMMENAGRTLAATARAAGDATDGVAVVAGNGGNGGGGMAAARHLHNHSVPVEVVLDRPPEDLDGPAGHQHAILDGMDVPVGVGPDTLPEGCGVLVDAVIGYGLTGPVRGTARDLVGAVNDHPATVVSLDVPSGVDAIDGTAPGAAVEPARVLTLALPKTGLVGTSAPLELADISVPGTVYDRLGVPYEDPFGGRYRVDLRERG